mgnify:FL=1
MSEIYFLEMVVSGTATWFKTAGATCELIDNLIVINATFQFQLCTVCMGFLNSHYRVNDVNCFL